MRSHADPRFFSPEAALISPAVALFDSALRVPSPSIFSGSWLSRSHGRVGERLLSPAPRSGARISRKGGSRSETTAVALHVAAGRDLPIRTGQTRIASGLKALVRDRRRKSREAQIRMTLACALPFGRPSGRVSPVMRRRITATEPYVITCPERQHITPAAGRHRPESKRAVGSAAASPASNGLNSAFRLDGIPLHGIQSGMFQIG